MRTRLILIADSLIIFLCCAGFYQSHEKAGLPVVFIHKSLCIEDVTQQSSALWQGDTLQAIDGIAPTSIDDVEFLLDAKSVGDTCTILVARNGISLSCFQTLVRFFSTPYLFIQIITSSLFVILGLFVYTKRKGDRSAELFHWVSLCAGLIIATTWGKFTIAPYGLGHCVRGVFNLAYPCAAVFFIHFSLVFPSNIYKNALPYLRLLYGTAICLAVVATYFFMRAALGSDIQWFILYNTTFNVIRMFFVMCLLAGFIAFVHSYFTVREESERRQLRWILLGLAIGPLSFITLWIVPQVFTSRGLVNEEYIIVTMLSVPVTFATAIVKYHILNIDQIFNRGSVYTIVFFVVLITYVAIVSASTVFIGTITVMSSFTVSVVAAVIIAALFQPIREKTQDFVDRKFFNVRYNYREAEKKFVDRIIYCYDETSIHHLVLESVGHVIPAAGTRLVLLDGRTSIPPEPVISVIDGDPTPLSLSEHIEQGAEYRKAEKAAFSGGTTVIGFRIHSDSRGMLGGLLLGPKKSGFRYNLEDIDLLDFFCHQTALALDRIHMQRMFISEENENKRLKELNDLKSLFVSSVTHELKTPLTSIKMFTELIERSPRMKQCKREEYFVIVKGESERLSRLIDNVLDISKIEKGLKEYRCETVDMNTCVNEAITTMKSQLMLHGFSYRLKLSKKKLSLRADKDAMIEILINLISNAIKFSVRRKSIIITTRGIGNTIRLNVQDFGIGIAEDDRRRIFMPFERTESPLVKQIPGTGLGLALVKHICDAHGATVEVDSEPGRGTTFSITFHTHTTKGTP
jgi:signal transduction histidine kinase